MLLRKLRFSAPRQKFISALVFHVSVHCSVRRLTSSADLPRPENVV